MKAIRTMALLENLDPVQEFVRKQLLEAACPEHVRIQIEMAVEEIYVNIVNYAYFPHTGMVEVGCFMEKKPFQAVIEFRDNGQPFNPLEHPQTELHLAAEEREIGGLGIFMTKTLMDEADYRYEQEMNILTLKKRLD